MNRVSELFHIVLLSCLCLGCTEAEMGGCDNASVTLEYSGDGVNDTFRQHIANVTYYIYDASGGRVATGKLSPPTLQPTGASGSGWKPEPTRWCAGESGALLPGQPCRP